MTPTGGVELGRRAHEVLARLDGLPTLSSVATRVLARAGADDADVQEIAELIEGDPALASRVLAMSARADRGLGRKVATVRQAAALLGLDAVRAAVLSVAVYEALAPGSEGARGAGDARGARAAQGFDRPGFWRHCLAVACSAELLSPYARPRPHAGEAFLCGLLHDAGRAMLDLALPGAYSRVLDVARQRGADSAAIEREVIGLDHLQAADRVFARWGLPAGVRDSAREHADPGTSVPMARLVGLARAQVRELHLGEPHDFGPPPSAAELAAGLGIAPAAARVVVKELPEHVRRRCELLGLDAEASESMLLSSIARANRVLGDLTERLARQERRARRAADVARRRAGELERAQRAIAEAERRAARAEAMARLGETTAGAAHELNNPLAVIHGRAQILAHQLTGDARESAEAIADAARRVTRLVSALHELAEPPTPRPEPLGADQLAQLIARVVGGARSAALERPAIQPPALDRARPTAAPTGAHAPTVEPGLDVVRVDRELLADALTAIADNAVQWDPTGRVHARAYADPAPGRWRIVVTDNGPGFSERALRHGLDAFFSERRAGRGTGLGLTRARAMIEGMGGHIELSNRSRGGAAVTIILPGREASEGRAAA